MSTGMARAREQKSRRRAERFELLSEFRSIILGAAASGLAAEISDLPLFWKIAIGIAAAVAPEIILRLWRKSDDTSLSQRNSRILLAAIIIAGLLFLIGAVVVGLSLIAVLLMLIWLLVMATLVLIARARPSIGGTPKAIVLALVAGSIGATLGVSLPAVIEVSGEQRVPLLVTNQCEEPFVIEDVPFFLPDRVEIGESETTSIDVPKIAVTIKRETNRFFISNPTADGVIREKFEVVIPGDETSEVTLNGEPFPVGESRTVKLSDQSEHELIIQCQSEAFLGGSG